MINGASRKQDWEEAEQRPQKRKSNSRTSMYSPRMAQNSVRGDWDTEPELPPDLGPAHERPRVEYDYATSETGSEASSHLSERREP